MCHRKLEDETSRDATRPLVYFGLLSLAPMTHLSGLVFAAYVELAGRGEELEVGLRLRLLLRRRRPHLELLVVLVDLDGRLRWLRVKVGRLWRPAALLVEVLVLVARELRLLRRVNNRTITVLLNHLVVVGCNLKWRQAGELLLLLLLLPELVAVLLCRRRNGPLHVHRVLVVEVRGQIARLVLGLVMVPVKVVRLRGGCGRKLLAVAHKPVGAVGMSGKGLVGRSGGGAIGAEHLLPQLEIFADGSVAVWRRRCCSSSSSK